MNGTRIHTGRANARSFLLLFALCACGPLPTTLDRPTLLCNPHWLATTAVATRNRRHRDDDG